jgi:hypothetical protein
LRLEGERRNRRSSNRNFDLLPVGAILLVRELGEVTGIWDRYEH